MKYIILYLLSIVIVFSLYGFIGPTRHNTMYVHTAVNGNAVLSSTGFTQILPASDNRHCLAICNLHPAIKVFINFRSVEVSQDETGLMISGHECQRMSGVVYTGPITAIAESGAPKVSFISY